MENSSPLVQDIETTARTSSFHSFRAFLDARAPGSAQAATQFYQLIDSIEQSEKSKLLEECRSRAWFVRNEETGAVRVAAKQCRLRWCFHCGESRQQFVTQALMPWYTEAKAPKLLTVTIKHTDEPLPSQIDFLYDSFRKFRNRKFLKDNIDGGVWFFQVTYNQKSEQWHPHIHALLDASFMDHQKLMELWEKITNGSTIVHIRSVNDPEHTLTHNARYAARPSALVKIPEDRWPDLFEAFDGRRICGTWGSARGISLRPQKPDDANKWHDVGGFTTVSSLVDTDDSAKSIWEAWSLSGTIEEGVNMDHIYKFDDDAGDKPPPKDEWDIEPYFDYVGNPF